jgi:hypothetical protein
MATRPTKLALATMLTEQASEAAFIARSLAHHVSKMD